MSAVKKEEKEVELAIGILSKELLSKKAEEQIDEDSLTSYTFCIRYLCEREAGKCLGFSNYYSYFHSATSDDNVLIRLPESC